MSAWRQMMVVQDGDLALPPKIRNRVSGGAVVSPTCGRHSCVILTHQGVDVFLLSICLKGFTDCSVKFNR